MVCVAECYTVSGLLVYHAPLCGFLVLGLTPTSIDLSALGMTNCTQYETLDSTTFFLAAAPSATRTVSVPDHPGLVGMALRSQVAVLAPGVHPFGAAVTNAVAIVLGSFE